jgi:alkylation response protein AidB-like acyl-CoA dehydrogenase
VRLQPTSEQTALRDSVAAFLGRLLPPSRLRELWASETGRDPLVWDGLAEIGVPGLLVGEEYGGAAGDETDLILVLEEAGRRCLPDEVVAALLTGPWLLDEAAPAPVRDEWLPGLAAGSLRVAIGGDDLPDVVPDAHVSDLVVLWEDDLATVHPTSTLQLTPLASMDPSRRLFRAVVPSGQVGVALRGGSELRAAFEARRLVGSAARLVGVAEALLATTVSYAATRVQFGRTIGSFQAVKHQLAHAASLQALAHEATATATALVAAGDDRGSDAACLARICAVEAEAECNRVALQVHGGVGFTWEHDLQIWLKHGKALEQADGGHRQLLERAGLSALAAVHGGTPSAL